MRTRAAPRPWRFKPHGTVPAHDDDKVRPISPHLSPTNSDFALRGDLVALVDLHFLVSLQDDRSPTLDQPIES